METTQASETYEVQLARERAERAEKIAVREKRFRAILKKLGFTLKKRDTDGIQYSTCLVGIKGDASIYLESGGYSTGWDRVHVSGDYPRGHDQTYITVYSEDNRNVINQPSINCGLAKTDDQIVVDITRRFLPDYEVRLAAVPKSIKADNEYRAKKRCALEQLKAVFTGGKGLTEHEERSSSFDEYLGKGFLEYARIEVKASSDSVDVKFHNITADQAAEIIKVVKGLRK